jgi:hypothetical protein
VLAGSAERRCDRHDTNAGSWHFAEEKLPAKPVPMIGPRSPCVKQTAAVNKSLFEDFLQRTLAMSLAASAATSGLRVLLIDADPRHPSASSFLGVKKAVGLVDLLLENANLQEVIKFRDCADVALFATSVLPGHIKRQLDLNARS